MTFTIILQEPTKTPTRSPQEPYKNTIGTLHEHKYLDKIHTESRQGPDWTPTQAITITQQHTFGTRQEARTSTTKNPQRTLQQNTQ